MTQVWPPVGARRRCRAGCLRTGVRSLSWSSPCGGLYRRSAGRSAAFGLELRPARVEAIDLGPALVDRAESSMRRAASAACSGRSLSATASLHGRFGAGQRLFDRVVLSLLEVGELAAGGLAAAGAAAARVAAASPPPAPSLPRRARRARPPTAPGWRNRADRPASGRRAVRWLERQDHRRDLIDEVAIVRYEQHRPVELGERLLRAPTGSARSRSFVGSSSTRTCASLQHELRQQEPALLSARELSDRHRPI